VIETQCFAADWYPTDPHHRKSSTGLGDLSSDPTPVHKFYAVGDDGIVFRYDGTSWSGMETGTTSICRMSGQFRDRCLCGGNNGSILHYGGEYVWEIWNPVLPLT